MINLFSTLLVIILLVSCNDSESNSSQKSNLTLFNSPADSVSAAPYLFTDEKGVIYLSWIEKGKDKSVLKFSVLTEEKWSAADTIISGNDWFVNWADYPMIASDDNGNIIAHFLQKSSESTYAYDVKLLTSADKGKSWSAPKILHDDGKKAEHGFVSIVSYNQEYFISWLDGRNTNMQHGSGNEEGDQGQMTIRGAVVNQDGVKISEWQLDDKVCDCCQTSATITANGPIVVYRDRTDDEIRDISIVRFINGSWTEPKTIFPDQWKIAGCPVNGPRSAAIGNNLAIAWYTAADASAKVNVTFSADGGETFDKPIRIDEGKAIGRVDIVMLDENSVIVSWMEGASIKAAKVYKDGRKDASFIVASSSEARASGFPQMTKSGKNIVFAWTDDKDKTIRVAKLAL